METRSNWNIYTSCNGGSYADFCMGMRHIVIHGDFFQEKFISGFYRNSCYLFRLSKFAANGSPV